MLVLAVPYPQGLAVLLLLRIMPMLGARGRATGNNDAMVETSLLQKPHAYLNASKPQPATQIS